MAEPGSILILDGAMGTELGRRGADITLPLWSARALVDAPGAVEQLHVEYLEAGAGAIVTNTFRTHRRSLAKAGFGLRAKELTRLAVEIALRARDRVSPSAMVFGSVAPLEDCYRPDLAPPPEACRAEHAEMIMALLDAGADAILFETIGTRHEALAAAGVADRLAPGRWMISFCLAADGPPGRFLDGAPLADILPDLGGASAVGVNCIGPDAIAPQIDLLRALLPAGTALMAYGNIGRMTDDGGFVTTDAVEPERYADLAAQWVERGAGIVGGCCGTTPATIRAVAQRLVGR